MRQNNIYEYLQNEDTFSNNLLLVCKNDKEAIKTAHTATFLNYKSFVLPDLRLSYGDDLRSFQLEIYELIEALHGYFNSDGKKV
ncbi:MAG TPA: transcription-repair coupling factor, partial [Campylobacterales bacterium]|nr:transcription-repair coupling factor [Campylobacterales bacterium]